MKKELGLCTRRLSLCLRASSAAGGCRRSTSWGSTCWKKKRRGKRAGEHEIFRVWRAMARVERASLRRRARAERYRSRGSKGSSIPDAAGAGDASRVGRAARFGAGIRHRRASRIREARRRTEAVDPRTGTAQDARCTRADAEVTRRGSRRTTSARSARSRRLACRLARALPAPSAREKPRSSRREKRREKPVASRVIET